MMRRIAALLVLLLVVTACGTDEEGWDPDQRFAPSLRPAFGARVTEGALQVWTGTECTALTRLSLIFDMDATLTLVPADGQPMAFDRLTLGGPYPGMRVETALPQGFDWRSAETLTLTPDAGKGIFGANANLPEVISGSPDHPDDTYYFQDVGWLDAAGVADRNLTSFLATCTPDPREK